MYIRVCVYIVVARHFLVGIYYSVYKNIYVCDAKESKETCRGVFAHSVSYVMTRTMCTLVFPSHKYLSPWFASHSAVG